MSSTGILHSGLSRRRVLSAGVTLAAAAFSPMDALAGRSRSLRKINLVSPRTGERLEEIYYVKGRYVPDAMQRINNILRDVRSDEAREMDPRLIDILSEAQFMLGHDRPFSIISGYRTPRTNAMLRRRSKGVAKKSYHVRGMAADLRMEGVSVAEIERAGKVLRAGGVGIYTKSNFVHLDSGPVRSWGR